MEIWVEERHCLALKSVTHPGGKALLSTASFQGSEETQWKKVQKSICKIMNNTEHLF